MSVKKDILTGVFWSAVEKYSGILLSIIISGILARLISPSDFGVIAIAQVIISFFSIFANLGIGPAIIQRKELTSNNLDSIFTFTILIGIILAVLFFSSSWLIASFYDNEKLIIVCHLLTINLFFASINIVPLAMMTRDKKFKLIAKRTLILQFFSGIISIISALKGAGMYALLISPIISSTGVFIYNFKYYPRKIDFKLDLTPLKLIYAFSMYQFFFSFFNYFSRNLDKLIIGRFYSIAELGFYEKSYRLMMLPLQNITHVITPVLQPVFSDMQHNPRAIGINYQKILKLVATISFPLSAFLFFSGGEIIRIFYGPNWGGAVAVFKILSLSLALQMLLSTSGSIYQSANSTKWQFYNGIFNTLCTVSGFIIATVFFKSIEGIAWAWNITLAINFISSFYILFNIVLRENFALFLWKALKVPCLIFILVFLGLFFVKMLNTNLALLSVMLNFLVTTITTLIVVQLTKHYNILKFVKSKINKV